MRIFANPSYDAHAAVHVRHDEASGLRAIVAQHRVWSKPCVGGCRLWAYPDEDAALTDVLRLSRGMTYKSVMAGLRYGGSKCVIMASSQALEDRAALFRAMGDFVQSLNGAIRTGVDVGLTAEDVAVMQSRTAFVDGTGAVRPDAATAEGVLVAIRAAVGRRFDRGDLKGLRVGVQGLGKVGFRLAELLMAEGAEVVGADVSEAVLAVARERLGIETVSPEAILQAPLDVLSPCALGAILNERTIPGITARVVAGSANNQLALPSHGLALADRDILYVPDYVANCGGLLAVVADIEGENAAWIAAKVAEIAPTLQEVFALAAHERIATSDAADRIARRRIDAITSEESLVAA